MNMRQNRGGFTLTEILIATAVSSVVVILALVTFSHATRQVRAGCSQVWFTAEGRLTAQKIVRYIEMGKAVGLASNGLNILTIDLETARISFDDGDGDAGTVDSNVLIYDPNTATAGGEVEICSHVSAIDGVPMFSLIPSSPSSAAIAFHLGDGSNMLAQASLASGEGYQGVEVRVSGTPRNLQRWYD